MRIHALVMLTAAMLAGGSAVADERYDRKLDEAAAGIVAARMGALRNGFAVDERPVLVRPEPSVPRVSHRAGGSKAPSVRSAPAPGEWRDGLAIAVERRSKASPEL